MYKRRRNKFLRISPKEQKIIIKALDSKRYPHEQELEVQTLIGRLYRSLKEIEERNGF